MQMILSFIELLFREEGDIEKKEETEKCVR